MAAALVRSSPHRLPTVALACLAGRFAVPRLLQVPAVRRRVRVMIARHARWQERRR